jgi:predicted nucleic acid-binding protein
MGQGYLIDTNTVIDYLNDKLPEKSAAFIERIESQLSVISRIELLAWPNATIQQLNVLNTFIAASNVYSLGEPIIIESIRIRKSFRIKLPDAIIAATTMGFELTLIIRNISDFNKNSRFEVHPFTRNHMILKWLPFTVDALGLPVGRGNTQSAQSLNPLNPRFKQFLTRRTGDLV